MGKEFITCKKFKSCHKKDVSYIDINKYNTIATASSDNMICFWDNFTAKLNKMV
jgi:WD40 repeat protein